MLATNENDVLDEFFRTRPLPRALRQPRRMRPAARRWTSPRRRTSSASSSTSSAAIPVVVRELWWELDTAARLRSARHAVLVGGRAFGFLSGAARTPTASRRSVACTQRTGVVVDPHTADGIKVAREHAVAAVRSRSASKPRCRPSSPRPSSRRSDHAPVPPPAYADLEQRPQRFERLADDAERAQALHRRARGLRPNPDEGDRHHRLLEHRQDDPHREADPAVRARAA